MKVYPINNINLYKNVFNNKKQNSKSKMVSCNNELGSNNALAFQGNYLRYLTAKKYVAEKVYPRLEKYPNKKFDLWDFDLNKLEGIQYDIKVFKNMSMKEIAFFLSTLAEVATFRGCYNNCAHCYADAKPPIKEAENQTAGMTWEDFTTLTNGIKALNKRLGFYASGKNRRNKRRYLTPFHDSDSMEVFMKDKNGKIYDVMEISKKLYESMGVKIIFDTASWHPKSKIRQEKAEKYIEFMAKPENKEIFYQVNISLNPFHAMHRKELELRKENKIELADKMRDLYTTRMANAFFTFTPLIKTKQLELLASATPDKENFDGYRINDLYNLYDEIIDKLIGFYDDDLNGEQKYVNSVKDAEKCLEKLNKLFANYRHITFAEKAIRVLNPDEVSLHDQGNKIANGIDELKDLKQNTLVQNNFVGILDSNGKYYLTDFNLVVPTEIKLNFDNDKETAPIRPNLMPKLKITKEQITKL